MDRSIVVVGALTMLCITVYDLKAAQMNMQHNLIREGMLYEIEMGP